MRSVSDLQVREAEGKEQAVAELQKAQLALAATTAQRDAALEAAQLADRKAEAAANKHAAELRSARAKAKAAAGGHAAAQKNAQHTIESLTAERDRTVTRATAAEAAHAAADGKRLAAERRAAEINARLHAVGAAALGLPIGAPFGADAQLQGPAAYEARSQVL